MTAAPLLAGARAVTCDACDVISRAAAARVVETRREPAVARHQPAPHKHVTSTQTTNLIMANNLLSTSI